MHQLLLLRHAQATHDDRQASDRERPLSARGERDAAAMRGIMRGMGLAPDLVLVSPARRTLETLAALEPWDDTPLTEQVEALYLADSGGMLGILREVAETVRSVLLIGHNPGLAALARQLVGNGEREAAMRLAAGFPTCTLASLMVAGPWRQVPSGVRLLRVVGPTDSGG